MVDVVEHQSLPSRLDSVDSGIAEESDSASPSVFDVWPATCDHMSPGMGDFVAGEGALGSCTSSSSEEEVRKVAFELAADLMRYATDAGSKPANRFCNTLRRLCRELFTKHEILFNSLVKKLDLTESDIDCRFLENVVDRMFSDKHYNWGRIVTVYAFAAFLAKHCVDSRMDSKWPQRIARETGRIIADKASTWIVGHGGWDAMEDLFKEQENMESKIWKGLLYTVVGLGALATTMAVVR